MLAWQMRIAKGESQRKLGALVNLTLHVDTRTMRLDQLKHKCQSNACTLIRPATRSGNAMESLKQMPQLVRWNTDTCVTDDHFSISGWIS